MRHSEFAIGTEFYTGSGKWRCTDIGTRVIVAIKLEPVEIETVGFTTKDGVLSEKHSVEKLSYREADKEGWFNGPPYAVSESVFDEYDLGVCTLDSKD